MLLLLLRVDEARLISCGKGEEKEKKGEQGIKSWREKLLTELDLIGAFSFPFPQYDTLWIFTTWGFLSLIHRSTL